MLPAGVAVPDNTTTLLLPQPEAAVWLPTTDNAGVAMLEVMFTVAAVVDVQPLLVLVTDNEYTPADVTLTLALLADPDMAPPLHVYVTPEPGPPLMVTVGVLQVITGVVLIDAVGFTVCVLTAIALLLVQPLVVLVTFNVYVPGPLPLALALFAPLLIELPAGATQV